MVGTVEIGTVGVGTEMVERVEVVGVGGGTVPAARVGCGVEVGERWKGLGLLWEDGFWKGGDGD